MRSLVAHELPAPVPDALLACRCFTLAVNLHIAFINSYLHNAFSCLYLYVFVRKIQEYARETSP